MSGRKRPWQGAETRLGLKIFGRDATHKSQPDAGIAWMLMRLRPHALDHGEYLVPDPAAPGAIDPTGAEYRTLRDDCGLSITEAASFHGVGEDAIAEWERASPPSAAAADLAALLARIEASAQTAVAAYRHAVAANPAIDGVELYRYEPWSYPDSQPAADGLPHGAHNRLVSRTADLLQGAGIAVAVTVATPAGSAP